MLFTVIFISICIVLATADYLMERYFPIDYKETEMNKNMWTLKPRTIEAVQVTDDEATNEEIMDWIHSLGHKATWHDELQYMSEKEKMITNSGHGPMHVHVGEWILLLANGQLSKMSNQEFQATFQRTYVFAG